MLHKEKQSAADIVAKLEAHLPEDVIRNEKEARDREKNETKALIIKEKKETKLSSIDLTDNTDILFDAEDDVEFARAQIKNLILKGNESFDRLMDLADAMDHPRAFEVLSNMMKTMGDLNHDLIDLQKKRKDIRAQVSGNKTNDNTPQSNNTIIFNGTTADMQREMKSVTIENDSSN